MSAPLYTAEFVPGLHFSTFQNLEAQGIGATLEQAGEARAARAPGPGRPTRGAGRRARRAPRVGVADVRGVRSRGEGERMSARGGEMLTDEEIDEIAMESNWDDAFGAQERRASLRKALRLQRERIVAEMREAADAYASSSPSAAIRDLADRLEQGT